MLDIQISRLEIGEIVDEAELRSLFMIAHEQLGQTADAVCEAQKANARALDFHIAVAEALRNRGVDVSMILRSLSPVELVDQKPAQTMVA